MTQVSKSIHQLQDTSEKKWLALLDQGDVTVTYGGKPVANLTKYQASPTPTPDDPATPAEPSWPPTNGYLPSDVLNLSNWYLTLPTSEKANPDTVKQPALASYSSKYFHINDARDAVVFHVNHGGATTSGSSNPRSELREMINGGKEMASWSSTSGRHAMTIRQRVTHLTDVKPHVVVGQIHDSQNDVSVFRLEGSKLWVTDGNNTHGYLLTDGYKLGTDFTVGFVVSGGVVQYQYNGQFVNYRQSKKFTGAYFKAGNYLQSNPKTAPTESTNAYAKVEILDLKVSHE